MAKIKYINAQELKNLYDISKLLICDVRESDEYNHEHIISAINTPLSKFNINEVNNLSKTKQLIFHCQSGTRTRMSEDLFKNINCEEVLILCDGIKDWKQLGFAVVKFNKAPLPIMRQVQIITGILVLIGILMSFLVNKYLIIISIFAGCGLIFAGITGFCGMAKLLMLLSFNKNNSRNKSCT